MWAFPGEMGRAPVYPSSWGVSGQPLCCPLGVRFPQEALARETEARLCFAALGLCLGISAKKAQCDYC